LKSLARFQTARSTGFLMESLEEEEAPEEGLKELFEKLSRESDLLKYTDLSIRVSEKAAALAFAKRFGEASPVLTLFMRHSSPASNLPVEVRSVALKRLDELLRDVATIKYLTFRAGAKGVEDRSDVQRLLVRAGDPAIEELLDALIDAPEASIRRNLFNTVILFGKKILPHIEKRLATGQWYAIRQMVAILGELGDPDTQRMLEAAYGHEDIRVKKEVLKSLARFQTARSTGFLMESLEEEDPSIKIQAIISLGMRRDPAAINRLGEIALKWEPFSDSQDTQKEAIKALGIIGDQKSSSFLTKILLRKKWLGKKMNEDLRVLAANSLGMLGGAEAYEAIEKARKKSTGDLYNACKRILEGREKKA
jgi:HEAT repeat protein